jgi:CheY-like chemotaxis protein
MSELFDSSPSVRILFWTRPKRVKLWWSCGECRKDFRRELAPDERIVTVYGVFDSDTELSVGGWLSSREEAEAVIAARPARKPRIREFDLGVETQAQPRPPMESRRILFVDQYELFRATVRGLLEGQGLETVGEAGTGTEALELVEELRPDIAIVEPDLPDMAAGDVLRQINKLSPNTRVVFLARLASEEDAESARRLGAAAYVRKDSSPDELCAALRTASA